MDNKSHKVTFTEPDEQQGYKIAEKQKRHLDNQQTRKQENECMQREIMLGLPTFEVQDSRTMSSSGRLLDPFI